jgi:hypothetical protein
MKAFVASAVALLLASTAADAAKFDLSYDFGGGNIFSAVFDGSVSGGLFTVTGVDSMSLNGTASPLSYSAFSTDGVVGLGPSGPGTFAVDGSYFDLYVIDSGASSAFSLNIADGAAGIIGVPIVGATVDLGGINSFVPFDPAAYSGHLEGGAVPEPASWALMLGGFGLIGGAMRSRKRVSAVSFG